MMHGSQRGCVHHKTPDSMSIVHKDPHSITVRGNACTGRTACDMIVPSPCDDIRKLAPACKHSNSGAALSTGTAQHRNSVSVSASYSPSTNPS